MKKLLILALLVCLGGCEKTVEIVSGIPVFEECINGYVFYTCRVGHGGGITQVMELVDGVTRPKMCGGGE